MTADETALPELPEPLEAELYDLLLDGDGNRAADERATDAKLDALCGRHPQHARPLRRLAERVRAGTRATQGVPTAEPPPPTRIGRFTLGAELGRGGFGVVYRAEQDAPLRRSVALKVLAPGLDAGSIQARFETERQLLARLKHPHIAEIHDAGTTAEGRPWFAMELIDGPTITAWNDREQPPLRDLLEVFIDVCDGVQHAHQQGVIHRDLKPGNVLVAGGSLHPIAKVIDFGIAKAIDEPPPDADATLAGALIGTPEYMSPEQARGEPADTRSDVFGLGALLYRLLTGVPPRDLRTKDGLTDFAALRREVSTTDPARPSRRVSATAPRHASRLRGDLDWITLTALHRDPQHRYASVAELATDLRLHLDGRPISARPPSFGYLLGTTWRRHRARLLALATAAILLVSTSVAMVWLWLDAREQEHLARRRAGELRAAFAELQHVTDPLRAAEQVRIATDELWPALPERAPAFDSWLAETRPLAERLERSAPNAPERSQLGRSIAEVASRRATTDVIAARMAASADLWQQVRGQLAADARFAGLELQPQTGLLPLGRDPVSGLQEFAHLLSGEAPERDGNGRLTPSADDAIVLVLVPGGPTRIGAQADDPDAPHHDPDASSDEGPVHSVDLAPFLIAKWEVTQAQWRRMSGGNNPSRWHDRIQMGDIRHSLLHPVENVSWQEAQTTLRRWDLELPNEVAWEHAARAGSDGRWLSAATIAELAAQDNISDRSYSARSPAGTPFEQDADDGYSLHAPVGSFAANDFGLYDMLGNVFEWSSNRFLTYRVAAEPGRGRREPPEGSTSRADLRVFRGGSYNSIGRIARVSRRSVAPMDARSGTIGMRPVRWLRSAGD